MTKKQASINRKKKQAKGVKCGSCLRPFATNSDRDLVVDLDIVIAGDEQEAIGVVGYGWTAFCSAACFDAFVMKRNVEPAAINVIH